MNLPRFTPAFLAALLAVFMGGGPALAGETAPPLSHLGSHFDLSIDHAFTTNIDDLPLNAKVSVTRANADFETAWQLCSRVVGTLYVGTEWTVYHFSDANGMFPGPPASPEPFDVMQDTTVRPGFIYSVNDQWSIVAGGIFELTGEPGADVGDSFRAGGYLGARWQQNKSLAWTLGITAETRLEDSVQFLPLVGLEWAVSDTVSVTVHGPSARVATRLNEEWTFILDAAYQGREYRLDDDSVNTGGVVRDTRVPVAAGFIWKPQSAKGLEVTVKAGAIVYQEFETLLSNGTSFSTVNSDMTPYIYLGGTWRF